MSSAGARRQRRRLPSGDWECNEQGCSLPARKVANADPWYCGDHSTPTAEAERRARTTRESRARAATSRQPGVAFSAAELQLLRAQLITVRTLVEGIRPMVEKQNLKATNPAALLVQTAPTLLDSVLGALTAR